MATSQAELERVRRVLNQIAGKAWADFLAAFADLPQWDKHIARRALAGAWPELVDTYGNMAAAYGADIFEEWAEGLGIRRPNLILADGVDPDRANARARWALEQPDVMGNMAVLLDELVKQPYRSTMHDSALASGAGWARVPTGSETCAFCRFLASRGGVYRSEQVAKFGLKGKKYHGHCDCTPVLVRSADDYPEGYDPDALYDEYSAARDSAGGDIKDIAAVMRAESGTN